MQQFGDLFGADVELCHDKRSFFLIAAFAPDDRIHLLHQFLQPDTGFEFLVQFFQRLRIFCFDRHFLPPAGLFCA